MRAFLLHAHGSTVIPSHIFTDLLGYIERFEIETGVAATDPLANLKKAQTAFIRKKLPVLSV